MTLNTVKDQELSLWIAEKLEPAPAWTPLRKSREYLGTFYSDGKCWQRRFDGEQGQRPQEPRDMVNDPACTVMLMEKLLCHHGVKLDRGVDPDYCLSWFDGQKWSEVDGESLGRAIAEAFALAHGWTA